MAWIRVCKPTVYDGLSIIELDKFSRALRLRWLWYSWDAKDRPWRGMPLPVDKDDMALFNAATRVGLGDGNTASFWNSSWLEGQAPASLYPTLFNHSRRKNRSVKEALTDSKWISDVDYNMMEQLIAEFVALWGRLQDVVLIPAQDDKIIWLHTSDGQYTARTAYELQFLGSTTSATADIAGEQRLHQSASSSHG